MQNAVWTAHARQSVRRLCLFVSVLLPGAVLLAEPGQTGAKEDANKPTLEQALKDKAPEIQRILWEKMDHPKDCLHIGVLKFQVQVGKGPPNRDAGPLNLYMARRLEAALILRLHQQEDKVRILHNPGEQVKTPADLTEKRGREVIFAEGKRRYRPAWWGNKQEDIPAHVFLTGVVKIQEAGETAEILIQAFDRRCDLVEVCAFQTAADPRLLTEAGFSFVLSRGTGTIKDWEVALANMNTAKADQKRPTARELLRQAPIDFQILYNGVQQPIAEDGTVPEPTSKDVVTFRLRHNNTDTKIYGVILKLNGRNTLWPDDADADDFFCCKKWLVKPHNNFEVKGFQTGMKTANEFKVLPPKESRKKALYYGEHAGTFTVIILEGRDKDEKPLIVPDRLPDVMVIARGVPDGLNDFGSLKALQDRLLAKPQPVEGKVVPKGIIEAGDKEKEHRVNLEPFDASAKRITVIQIRYYKP